MSEPEEVLALVKEIGVGRLGGADGCMCLHFNIRRVDIDVSCGKGRDRGLWISSRSMDYWDSSTANDSSIKMLRPIAEEVARQVEDSDGRGPVPIHYHEWGKERAPAIDGESVRVAGKLLPPQSR